jgi:uracil-DNA glycosylase family 4
VDLDRGPVYGANTVRQRPPPWEFRGQFTYLAQFRTAQLSKLSQDLLERRLTAVDLERKQVYIANIVECRPPNNRNPDPDEAAACRAFPERQIALIRPRLIVSLGAVSANNLLGNKDSVGRLRGRPHQYQPPDGSPPMPLLATYHPTYYLRSPAEKGKGLAGPSAHRPHAARAGLSDRPARSRRQSETAWPLARRYASHGIRGSGARVGVADPGAAEPRTPRSVHLTALECAAWPRRSADADPGAVEPRTPRSVHLAAKAAASSYPDAPTEPWHSNGRNGTAWADRTR